MLQPVIFVVPAGSGPGVEAQMKSKAEAFRLGYKGCDGSLQQAAGAPGIVVKPTVRRDETQLTGDLKTEVAALSVGAATTPGRIEEGFQLLGLCSKKEVAGKTSETEEVRSELSSERGQLLARRYLRDLRSDAVIEYR